jgi:hypothetical protein
MQKMLTQLEFKVAEKVYHFVCDPDSPIEHVKEALFQIGKYVGAIEDAIKAQQAKDAQSKTEELSKQPANEPIK